MATPSSALKTVLLLSPHRLPEGPVIVESLHVIRDGTKMGGAETTRFEIEALDQGELVRHYASLPKVVMELLLGFSRNGMDRMGSEIQKRFTAQRAGLAFEPYYRNAMSRKVHELMDRLKPFTSLLKWYHKKPTGTGRFTMAPCRFSDYRPQLQFSLKKEGEDILLDIQISLNGSLFGLDTFQRFHFLLESNSEYFLLSFKDYQTLEWLNEQNLQSYERQPEALAARILSKLEEDYKVERNDLLQKNAIQTAAVHRLMLSEISGSFLVLTPQWLYDGFLVEGPWKETYETIRQGVTYVIQRDKEAESTFVRLLESLHEKFPRQMNGYYHLSFSEAQHRGWFLKVYHKLLEENIQVAGMDMLKHFRYSAFKPSVSLIQGAVEGHLVSMEMSVRFGEEEVSLLELQKMLLSGGRAILLKDGSLGVLGEEWMAQYGILLRHGKIAKKEIKVPRWLAFSEDQDNQETQVLKPLVKKDWWEKWKLWQAEKPDLFQTPSVIQASLRPYQAKGYQRMALLAEAGAGACLADDMGLGKTLQTICYLAHRASMNPLASFLIVCPSSLIYNWQEELQKFAPTLSSQVHHGASRNPAALGSSGPAVWITSYGTARSDIELLSAHTFDTVVLDESHHIKNPEAQITRAVQRLQAVSRVALSGTPVMNNTFDLYAQLDFLLPGLLGSREFFRREYADPIDREQDPDKIQALRKLTAPFILRRTKEQVAPDLPPKTEIVLWCQMGMAQKNLYEEIRDNIRGNLLVNIKAEGLGKSKLAVLQGIMKLRQICNSPLLLPKEEQTSTESIKTDMLVDELTGNLKGHKVLVFSQFARMLDLLAEACDKEGISYFHFDGSTPPAKRAEMVSQFQDPASTIEVFLISLKAGNAGLNLTAADYVVLFDPWWNTAVQQQAIDRTHRIGQTKNVFAYKMICKDTIEEKILALQQRKSALAGDLISEDEGFVKALSEEDITYLFS
jgi:superfamily II DNA or RNA helicase